MNASLNRHPKALLIVVTYNSRRHLPDIAQSIQQFVGNSAENFAIVVENSGDCGVVEFMKERQRSSRVHVELPANNEGFSRGVNAGYTSAREQWGEFDFVVLLNPDVLSAGPVICELVDRAASRRNSSVGIWGPILRDAEGGIDKGCARRIWNRRRFLSHLLGYDDLARYLGTAPRVLSEAEVRSDQGELAILGGALMCIDTSILGNGLDTMLPMYLEDQEICMRAKKLGRSVEIFPDLEAIHSGAASRKSLSGHDRALRVMELVEAPAVCMSRIQDYSQPSVRALVLLGGALRILASIAVGLLRGVLYREPSSQFAWVAEQCTLGLWFMAWAAKGPFHTTDVSLAEYFREYLFGR